MIMRHTLMAALLVAAMPVLAETASDQAAPADQAQAPADGSKAGAEQATAQGEQAQAPAAKTQASGSQNQAYGPAPRTRRYHDPRFTAPDGRRRNIVQRSYSGQQRKSNSNWTGYGYTDHNSRHQFELNRRWQF